MAIRPKLRLVQQAHALAQHPAIKMLYSGTTGIFGTVAANITALTTEQAHANTSAQNLTLLLFQSDLMYFHTLSQLLTIISILFPCVPLVCAFHNAIDIVGRVPIK